MNTRQDDALRFELRVASTADADEIASLVNRAYRPGPRGQGWTDEADLVAGSRTDEAQVVALFRSGSTVLTMCRDGAIVACVHVQREESGAAIGMLATEPNLQATGLGKQMISHAEQYATAHFGAQLARMHVLSSRSELMQFYLRRGYARTGEVEDYPVGAGVGKPLVDDLKVEVLAKRLTVTQLA